MMGRHYLGRYWNIWIFLLISLATTGSPQAKPSHVKTAPPAGPVQKATPHPLSAQQIYNKFKQAVATIKTDKGLGTGFATDIGIWTCYHVIDGVKSVTAEFPGMPPVELTHVLSMDRNIDMATLLPRPPNGPILKINYTDEVKVGDPLVVIGSPHGLDQTLTEGLLSGKRTVDGIELLQLSAAISPGSSGSPVFNKFGEVVGMVVSYLANSQQINFAVSAKSMVAEWRLGIPLQTLFRAPPPETPKTEGNSVAEEVKSKINPKDGAVMLFIPAGPFLMGDDDDAIKDKALSLGAQSVRNNPRHTVTLSGYWIYKDLVTVGMYKRFCQATGRQMPPDPVYLGNHFNPNWSKEDHPIVNVDWDDAMAYCAWAGVNLPTEAQWEKAARGVDSRLYPWGNAFDPSKVWASKSQMGDAGGTHRVGELGISPYGCTDMAGNVWQWCADWYDPGFWASAQAKAPDPMNTGVGEKKYRVVRGGSWFSIDGSFFRASFRGEFLPTYRDYYFGFRCASSSP